MKTFSTLTKCDLNLNFKNVNRLINILRNIKSLISHNKVKHNELITPTYKYIDQYSQSMDYHRKLNEIFGMFLVNTDHTFKVKQLIWAVFIYLRCKLLKLSTNILEKLLLLFKVFTAIINKVPLVYFPSSLGITNLNKLDIIKTKLSEKTRTNITNFNFESIIESLPSDLEFKDDKIDMNLINKHIDNFYLLYAKEYLQNDIMFDERILLTDLFKTYSSPVKTSSYSQIKVPDGCARRLFSEPQNNTFTISTNHSNPFQMFNSNYAHQHTSVDMTPFTRVVSLENWVKTFIANFDEKDILQMQDKYLPKYDYLSPIKPLNSFIITQFQIFEKQLSVYKFRLITRFSEMKKMCLKFISELFKMDLMIFTEEFCAMLLYNKDFIKSMIAISIEIILFVEDIQEISFHKIPELFGVDLYDLWKVLNPLVRFASFTFTFHTEIKEHLEEIEYQLVSFLIWKKPSNKFVNDIKDLFKSYTSDNNYNKEKVNNNNNPLDILADFEYTKQSLFLLHCKEDFTLNYENKKEPQMDIYKDIRHLISYYKDLQGMSVFLRRVINYSNLLNKNIFIDLKLNNISNFAVLSEEFIKQIIINENTIESLYSKHIDQVIICAVISILSLHDLFSFETNTNTSNVDFVLNTNIVTLKKLKETYIKCKPSQIRQVSEMIFEKVKVSDKKYLSLIEYYNKNFKLLFQEQLIQIKQEHCDGDELINIHPIKRRKLSDSLNNEINKNINKEALHSKSAFSYKVENYILFEKKIYLSENIKIKSKKNTFLNANIVEFKSRRTQLLKELYSYLVKSDLELSSNKQENPILKKLRIGLDNSAKSKSYIIYILILSK